MRPSLLRYCSACLLSLWLCLSAAAADIGRSPNPKLDLSFKRWGEYYLPGRDWHWWRAQGVAESNLNPLAHSQVGALGVMQLMPDTAKELGVNPLDPEQSIQGGIRYDAHLLAAWKDVSDPDDRLRLAFASYNAGATHLRRAVTAARSTRWPPVAAALPAVTGDRAPETVRYVSKIWAIYGATR